MRCVVGIDLGGTKTAAGLVDEHGRVLHMAQTPTLAREGAEAILESTAELIRGLLHRAGTEGWDPQAIGVGSAGVIDPLAGVVVSATDSILGWAGTRLADELVHRTGLPVWAINDVHAHAMGESWLGASKGQTSSLLVAVGTGVGGSLIENGVPQLGAHFSAGHVGHIASPYAYDDGEPLPCTCGRSGHVEAIASGPSILQWYRRLALADKEARSARDVYTFAVEGDLAALEAITRGAAATGQAIGGLANILDPSIVVISGGMADSGPIWWDSMQRAFESELMDQLVGLPVVHARLGNGAAVIGAAKLAYNESS